VSTRFLVRGGCVLTLATRSPNLPRADVLIDDGVVAEIGQGLRARDAEVVEAADTIVMPGFVDTHRHTWRSLLRNVGAAGEGLLGPAAPDGADERYGPEDVYAATLIGLLGAAEAGITTVVDWFDGAGDEGAAEAALQAHADAGLRTVLVAAAPEAGAGDAGPATRERLARLARAAGPTTTIAHGVTGLGAVLDGRTGDWAAAREAGARVHVHLDGPSRPGAAAGLASAGLLGDGVTLVHGAGLGDADLDAVAATGTSVSLTPSSEMAGGRGAPPIQALIDRNVKPGLGVDDERVAPGDLFAQMRATISLQHATVFDRKLAGKAGLPRLMSTRDVIRSATVEGARVAGLRGVTGSLEPGLRADVIVLRTDRPNIFPVNDPIGAVVWGMDTSNVDWVFADGRAVMREGVLQADVARARELATAARRRVADPTVVAAPGAER
jgi:cytosine/adenosine deaminase-related metal-dependent hydrolase